jgi:Flp pilus assembly protein CpaB
MKITLLYFLATCLVVVQEGPPFDPNHRQVRGAAIYVGSVKGGPVKQGSYVDVVHTVATPNKSSSRLILENIFVRGVDKLTNTVTLEVEKKRCLELINVKDHGSFTLIVRSSPTP